MSIGYALGFMGLVTTIAIFYYKRDLELLKQCKGILDRINRRVKLHQQCYIVTGEEPPSYINNVGYINKNYKEFNSFAESIESYKLLQSKIAFSTNIKVCKEIENGWKYEFCSSSGSIKDLLKQDFLDKLFAEMAGMSVNRPLTLKGPDLFEKVLSVICFLKPEKEGKLLYTESMKKYKEL